MNIEHIQQSEMEAYVQGTLNEGEDDRIVLHLGECEICLEKVDLLWHENEEIGSFDQYTTKRQLMRRINRTNILGHLIGLSVKGFVYMIIGLLYPLRRETQVKNQKEQSKHE